MNRPTLHRICCVAAAAVGTLAPLSDAQAWGNEGHQVIAEIALARLTPAARKKVNALLAADADTLTPRDFASRATWADRFRDSDRMTTKVHYNATREWHFVDIDLATGDLDAPCHDHPPLPAGTAASDGPKDACVVDKIEQFKAELARPGTSKAERLLALKFLLHFIGDVHQPLHAAEHEHDAGGNGVPVLYGQLTQPDNLHAYWDTRVVRKLGSVPKTVAASLAAKITPALATQWSKGTGTSWAKESFVVARDVAYHFGPPGDTVDEHGTPVHKLDAAYEQQALVAARKQLSRAGVRLAWVLNQSLK
jgi:hypothetical protein